jgi:hypothetical protein
LGLYQQPKESRGVVFEREKFAVTPARIWNEKQKKKI